MLEVLKVSVAERSKEMSLLSEKIWTSIYDEEVAKEKIIVSKQYFNKLEYYPNIIGLKKKIMKRVSHYGKYYLDKE